jgi:hypothetical protein
MLLTQVKHVCELSLQFYVLLATDLNVVVDIIDLVADETVSLDDLQVFEQLALVDRTFRQKVTERKERYRSQGESVKADRLNAAMVNMLRKSLGKFALPHCHEDESE